jgi:hypothetical protein
LKVVKRHIISSIAAYNDHPCKFPRISPRKVPASNLVTNHTTARPLNSTRVEVKEGTAGARDLDAYATNRNRIAMLEMLGCPQRIISCYSTRRRRSSPCGQDRCSLYHDHAPRTGTTNNQRLYMMLPPLLGVRHVRFLWMSGQREVTILGGVSVSDEGPLELKL